MANSKVVYDGETLIDISNDTVTPETLAKGATAHDSSGEPITGTMELGDYEGAINAHNESETAHQDIREDLDGKVSKSGDTMSGGLEVPSVGRNNYIAYPKGGFFTDENTVTGYIKIVLPPTAQTNTMVKFNVSIYSWRERAAIDYVIGGYLYSRWMNTSAHCVAPTTYLNSNLPVAFIYDNGRYIVKIGTAETTWSYPNIVITNVLAGHMGGDYNTWASGWSVSISTDELPAAQVTLTDTNIVGSAIPQNVLLYEPQTLTVEQQTQARTNLAAICEEDTLECIDNHDKSNTAHSDIRESISGLSDSVSKKFNTSGGTFTGIVKAHNNTAHSTKQIRNTYLIENGNNLPEDADEGDICLIYAKE